MASESLRHMRTSRRMLGEEVPAMEKVVTSIGGDEWAKRNFLRGVRDTQGERGSTAYLAYCAKYPRSVLERAEDPESAAKRADWAYTGPYVNPWDLALEKRRLELDDRGNTVHVSARQHDMFGVPWSRQWQDCSSASSEGDAAQDLGPRDEIAVVRVKPPSGGTWAEVAQMQRMEKRGYEKGRVKERRARERGARLEMVKRFLRRLEKVIRISKGKDGVSGAEGGAVSSKKKGCQMAEKRVDSGRASTVAG